MCSVLTCKVGHTCTCVAVLNCKVGLCSCTGTSCRCDVYVVVGHGVCYNMVVVLWKVNVCVCMCVCVCERERERARERAREREGGENIRKRSKSAISRSLTWCATLLRIFLKYFLRFLWADLVWNEFIEFFSTPPTSNCAPSEKYSKIMPYFSRPANVKLRTCWNYE